MNRRVITLSTALCLFGSAAPALLAQQPAPKDAPAAPPAVAPVVAPPAASPHSAPQVPGAPQVGGVPLPANSPLKFDITFHDYGKIPDSEPVHFDFTFTNTSDHTVNITDVHASCGCTNVASDKVIAPGKSGKVTTTFNPAGRQGRETKQISVTLDDKDCPRIELTTTAEVLKRIMVEPMQVYMGEVPFKQGGSQEVTLTGRAENFDVTGVTLADPNFKIEQVGKDQVDVSGEKLNRVKFKVTLNNTAPISRLQSNAAFTTNDAKSPTVNVAVIADVVGQLRLSPPQIGVRIFAPGEPFVSEAVVDSRDGKPFTISGIEYDPAGTPPATDMKLVFDVVPREPGSKAAYRIKVSGTTPANAGEVRGNVRVQTDAKDQETINFQLIGFQMAPQPPQIPQQKPVARPETGIKLDSAQPGPGNEKGK